MHLKKESLYSERNLVSIFKCLIVIKTLKCHKYLDQHVINSNTGILNRAKAVVYIVK
jgi:hypothetical protein